MGKRDRDEDDDRLPDMGAPGTRRLRTETIDHAAMSRALREAFEAGGASARSTIDAQAAALREAYAEIGRSHAASNASVEKSQELVGRLQMVANQNVSLTLAEQNGRVAMAEVEQRGLNLRHGITTLATNPYLGLVLQKFLPDLNLLPPRPAGPGNTPIEAVQRLAASLRTGSDGSKILLDVLANYCAEELERPGDVALLIEYLNEIASKDASAQAPESESESEEQAAAE
jgi:hypothetical protein